MKKISKRSIIVASSVMATTAVIGIPAAAVYATKDDVSEGEISQNISQKLEDKIFGSINLLPADTGGKFDSSRMKDNQDTLNKDNEALNEARIVYTKEVKAMLPAYGVLNDIINAAERFDSQDEIEDRADDAIKNINAKNWDALKETLFDLSNGGKKKLLSSEYGVTRSDLKGYTVKGETHDSISYKTQNGFISFDDVINKLKDGKGTVKQNVMYTQILISGIESILGENIINDGTVTNTYHKDTKNNARWSIPYMVISLRNQAKADAKAPADKTSIENAKYLADKTSIENAKYLYDAWENNILPAWNTRSNSIDQFFDDDHAPVKGNDMKDTSDLEAFKIYDTAFHSLYKDADSLGASVETFMDGTDVSGYSGTIPGQNDPKFITNWDFLSLFFGEHFNAKINNNISGVAGESFSGEFGWDKLIADSKGATVNIKDSDGSTLLNVKNYWTHAIDKIFSLEFPEETRADGNIEQARNLFTKISYTKELGLAFVKLDAANKAYDAEVTKISTDPFSIGIKLNDLQDIIRSYGIKDGWKIKINSLIKRTIGQKDIDDLVASLDFAKDGSIAPSLKGKYNLKDGFIYPTGANWVLRATDSLSLADIKFNDGSKLKPFEDNKHQLTIFKPYIRINENTNTAGIEILWDHIPGEVVGGKND